MDSMLPMMILARDGMVHDIHHIGVYHLMMTMMMMGLQVGCQMITNGDVMVIARFVIS